MNKSCRTCKFFTDSYGFKRKTIISKRAKKMRRIAKLLKRFGVCVDLEQR